METKRGLARLAREYLTTRGADEKEALVAALQPHVVRAARLSVGPGSLLAEDAAQAALMDIIGGIERLRNPDTVYYWALQVTCRRARKLVSRERRLRPWTLFQIDDAALDTIYPERDSRQEAIRKAFRRLPPQLRLTAVLRFYFGLSEEETAAVLNRSVKTVKSNTNRARTRLASSLTEEGIRPSVRTPAFAPTSRSKQESERS